VNVLGAIKTTGATAELESTGLVLALYRHHFGTLPVAVVGAPKPLDVAAAWTNADRQELTVAVVNPTTHERRLSLQAKDASLFGAGRRFVVTGAGPLAHNEPGRPRGVEVSETSVAGAGAPVEVPPLSVALFVFPVETPTSGAAALPPR
jgi:alpha-L-arabinofuranosidase